MKFLFDDMVIVVLGLIIWGMLFSVAKMVKRSGRFKNNLFLKYEQHIFTVIFFLFLIIMFLRINNR